MAVLGFDLGPLRSAITELGQGVRQGAQQAPQGGAGGGDYLGYLAGLAPQAAPLQGPAGQMLTQVAQARPSGLSADFMGQLGDYARQSSGLGGPAFGLLGNLYQGTGGAGGVLSQTWGELSAFGDQLAANAAAKAAAAKAHPTPSPGPAPSAAPTSGGTGGATYSGLPSGVAQWADQTNSTFGGLGSWVPAAMLAIIQHESGGSPTAYNQAGDAWGLFQQLHLNSNDPNAQFAAAQQLAQDKLASLDESYRRNGLNPDERTRARDLFLAWAGHFDYDTGQPNAGSRDVGSGQDYQSFLNEIMPMYDNIVKGRQQAPAGGGGTGLAGVTPGTNGQIMQEFGPTDYSAAHPSTYAYGNAYGLAGSQHPGVDWAVPSGTRVASPLAGTVSVVGNDHGTGYYYSNPGNADPDHSGEFAVTLANGDILILGHMSRINVNVGDKVNAGDLIGLSGGSDGDHVHVEYRRRNADGSYTIVDPRSVLGG
jgi:murein DD-endopeptidase MepM/ murein hydrolase activator NlpD